jgi:hypothetical protein
MQETCDQKHRLRTTSADLAGRASALTTRLFVIASKGGSSTAEDHAQAKSLETEFNALQQEWGFVAEQLRAHRGEHGCYR